MPLPDNWPSDVIYTPVLLFGQSEQARAMQLACITGEPLKNVRIGPQPLVDGFGLFAACDLPANRFIGNYTGVVKPHVEYDPSVFVFDFDMTNADGSVTKLNIDAEQYGNETRMINHYQHIADEPNVTFMRSNRKYRRDGVVQNLVEVYTTKPICKGEELLCSYGEEYWEERENEALRIPVYVKICEKGANRTLRVEVFQHKGAQFIIEELILYKEIAPSKHWRIVYKGQTLDKELKPISHFNVEKESELILHNDMQQ